MTIGSPHGREPTPTPNPAPTGVVSPAAEPAIWMLIVIAFISALGPFAIDMYLPAMPGMAAALSTNPAMIQLTITAYLIGLSIGPLFLAPLSDAYGRKIVQTALLVSFSAISVGCALASNVETLIALRGAQAVVGGAAMASMRALMSDLYQGDALSRASSFVMSVFTIAPIVAPLIGAWLIQIGDWRWIFWALVGVSLLSASLMQLLPETLPPERRTPYRPATVVGGYIEIARSPLARRYLASTFFFALMFFAMLSASPFIFIDHYDVGEQGFAIIFGLISACAIAGNFINAKLVFRHGYNRMLVGATIGLGALAVVMGVVASTGLGGVYGVVAVMIWLMAVFHVSIANTLAGLMAAMGRRAGAASAAMAFCRFAGGAIGSAMVGAFNTSHPWPFALAIGVSAVGAALSLRIGRSAV